MLNVVLKSEWENNEVGFFVLVAPSIEAKKYYYHNS